MVPCTADANAVGDVLVSSEMLALTSNSSVTVSGGDGGGGVGGGDGGGEAGEGGGDVA